MNRLIASPLFLAALLALPLAAHAQRLERTFSVGDNPVVEVRNLKGQVTIQSWTEQTVKVVALRRSTAVETHLDQSSNRVHIHTHLLQSSAPVSERVVDYEIWAPVDTRLELYLETGQLEVKNFTRDVSVESVAADVRLENLNGHTAVQSLNGSVVAERCSGTLEVSSISGNLRFTEGASPRLKANTTSGDIVFNGGLRPGGSYEFINHEGAIDIFLPPAASFELNARSVKGQVIVSEFPLKAHRHGRLAPRSTSNSVLGTVLAGEAMVRATSFSGTIRVRQQ